MDQDEMFGWIRRGLRAPSESWHYAGGAVDVPAVSSQTWATAAAALRRWAELRAARDGYVDARLVASNARRRTVLWGMRFTYRPRVRFSWGRVMVRVGWTLPAEARDRQLGSELDLWLAAAERTLAVAPRVTWYRGGGHLHVGVSGRERLRELAGTGWVRGLTGPTALDAMGREAEELWTHD